MLFSRWRVVAISAVVIAGAVFALPKVLPKAWLDTLGEYAGVKSLDRENVIVELDREDLLDRLIAPQLIDIRAVLRQSRIGFKLNRTPSGATVEIMESANAGKANELINEIIQTDGTDQLLTLERSDPKFNLVFSENAVEKRTDQAVEQALWVVRNRLNGFKIADASAEREGKKRIRISSPRVNHPDRHGRLLWLIDVLDQAGVLTFQIVCESQPIGTNNNPPPGCDSYPMRENSQQNIWVQTASAAVVNGSEIVDANTATGYGDEPVVNFKFNQKGAEHLGKITTDNVGKALGIVLDRQIISAPRIAEPILGGAGQISGNFTAAEANSLAIILRSGALPARLVYIDTANKSAGDAQAKRSDL